MTAAGRFVLVVVGLDFEARLAARAGAARAVIGRGAGLAAAGAAARAPGCVGVLSFGLAGALDPALRPGRLLVASEIVEAGARRPCDAAWREALLAAAPGALAAPLLGAREAVSRREDKARLFAETGAAAVDMESAAAAALAEAAGLPLAALRAVADPAERAVPRAALAGMRPDGSTDALAVLRALASRPAETPALLRVALDAAAGRRALAKAAARLGPALGAPVDAGGDPVDARAPLP